ETEALRKYRPSAIVSQRCANGGSEMVASGLPSKKKVTESASALPSVSWTSAYNIIREPIATFAISGSTTSEIEGKSPTACSTLTFTGKATFTGVNTTSAKPT